MPDETFEQLQNTWVCGQKLAIRLDAPGGEPPPEATRPRRFAEPRRPGLKRKHGKGPSLHRKPAAARRERD
jgi:hypothetical protein